MKSQTMIDTHLADTVVTISRSVSVNIRVTGGPPERLSQTGKTEGEPRGNLVLGVKKKRQFRKKYRTKYIKQCKRQSNRSVNLCACHEKREVRKCDVP